jgi:hypothetical protein
MDSVLEGGCIYLPGFLCAEPGDFTLLRALTADLEAYAAREGQGLVNWSKHLK